MLSKQSNGFSWESETFLKQGWFIYHRSFDSWGMDLAFANHNDMEA